MVLTRAGEGVRLANMEWVLGSAFVGGMLVRAHRRNVARAASQRDHRRRAGDGGGTSSQDAFLRASGNNAWMRHGGG